jgi:hypothetical protein
MPSKITANKNIHIVKNIPAVWKIISDVNSWAKWNPSIDHAVLYGQFEKGSKLKLISGKWEFDCVIDEIEIEKSLNIYCKTMGLIVTLQWNLKKLNQSGEIKLEVSAQGFLANLVRKKTLELVDGILESTLTSLKYQAENTPDS